MSNWYGVTDEEGKPEWHYSDRGDGTLWQENGAWKFRYLADLNESWSRHELGPAESLDEAKWQAEKIMERIDYLYDRRIQLQEEGVTQPDPEQPSVDIPPEDVRALLEVAETVDDMTQHERDAYDRVRHTLDEHERHIAQHSWKVGLSNDNGEPYMVGVNVPTQDEIAAAEAAGPPDILRDQTRALRGEVQAALAAWDEAYDNNWSNQDELEQAYRDKLTDLDRNLEERGITEYEDFNDDRQMGLTSVTDEHDRALSDRLKQSLEQSLDQSLNRGHHKRR
jgi:hypothetical protein